MCLHWWNSAHWLHVKLDNNTHAARKLRRFTSFAFTSWKEWKSPSNCLFVNVDLDWITLSLYFTVQWENEKFPLTGLKSKYFQFITGALENLLKGNVFNLLFLLTANHHHSKSEIIPPFISRLYVTLHWVPALIPSFRFDKLIKLLPLGTSRVPAVLLSYWLNIDDQPDHWSYVWE